MSKRRITAVHRTVSFAEAIAYLHELDHQYGIIPARNHAQITDGITAITDAARTLTRDGHLTEDLEQAKQQANKIIAAASGIPAAELTHFHNAERAERLHLTRNLLLVICMAGVLSYQGEVEAIVEDFPALKRRTSRQCRPHFDDEILLLRLWALWLSRGDRKNKRSAAVYAQCDTGVIPGETGLVRAHHANVSVEHPTIEAPGLGAGAGVAARTLSVDPFPAHLLRTHLEANDLHPKDLLTYMPRRGPRDSAAQDYSAAAASVDNVVNNMRIAVGLRGTSNARALDTTAASIWMWRAEHTRDTKGYAHALTLSGRSSLEQLQSLLRHAAPSHHKKTAPKRFSKAA